MDVPIPYLINDTRKIEYFKKQKYYGYKKLDIIKIEVTFNHSSVQTLEL